MAGYQYMAGYQSSHTTTLRSGARDEYWSRFLRAYGRRRSPAEPPRPSAEMGVPDAFRRSTSYTSIHVDGDIQDRDDYKIPAEAPKHACTIEPHSSQNQRRQLDLSRHHIAESRGERAVTSNNRFCIGGIDKNISRDYHLVRFIEEKDLSKCKARTFLVGSIERNKKFDDARADLEEFTATVSWPNSAKEQWTIAGDDGPRYLGIRPGKKITALAGRGGLTRSGRPLVSGNPLSLSLSMIPKALSGSEKRTIYHQIRRNIGLPKGTPALWFKSPDQTLAVLTRRLSDYLKITS